MTKTYEQIVKQIKALEEEAEKIRRKEIDGVIARIREAITAYNLTAQDLGFGRPASKAAPGRRKVFGKGASKSARAVKFADGKGGTWGGRGKRPQWLRDALAAGRQLSDFAV